MVSPDPFNFFANLAAAIVGLILIGGAFALLVLRRRVGRYSPRGEALIWLFVAAIVFGFDSLASGAFGMWGHHLLGAAESVVTAARIALLAGGVSAMVLAVLTRQGR